MDEMEDIQVTSLYKTMVIAGVVIACALMLIGLWNADTLAMNEKGFFTMSFVLGLFAAVVTQKNVRDLACFDQTTTHPATETARRATENKDTETL
ncbi:hypothetical protein KDD30_20630 (plasmid) [Photobacterium sp. GJ3]|uniref:YiaA/YiaB family inner membrane protein n=1 Tax=Photobacterium sp. GJ3 TaxID=2829502 RepID=UPI001B8CD295|nr:YiaA/YiaB family inner membrane protein [Photobacterium sp. GJ3]QUJ70499.1 hypothetical protein KDD30_20630 [Photobacterium sp. GJ3]